MSVIKSNMTPEQEKQALENYRPPNEKIVRTKRRIFELEIWIQHQNRYVYEEEIIAYAMRHFNIDREQAKKYLQAVIEDFKKVGVPVMHA